MRLAIHHIDHGGGIAITILAIAIVAGVLLFAKGDKVGSYGDTAHQGIDVSHHQGYIDWKAVASEGTVKFAYIKATEGATHQDTRYDYNIAAARENGIKVGSYHYFHPDVPVKEQAENFLHITCAYPQDLVPAIDIEECGGMSPQQICDSIAYFASLLQEQWHALPLIYTHQKFYNRYLQNSFNEYPLWIARYGFFLIKPRPQLEDDRTPDVWQYSNRGKVDGIKGRVDLNALRGTIKLNDLELVKQI